MSLIKGIFKDIQIEHPTSFILLPINLNDTKKTLRETDIKKNHLKSGSITEIGDELQLLKPRKITTQRIKK